MRYICKEDLCLEKYDDNGFNTNKSFWVNKGTLWEKDEGDYRFIGDNNTIHLDRIWKSKHTKTVQWVEITKETLEEYFEILSE